MFKTLLLLLVLTASCAFGSLQFSLSPSLLESPPGGLPNATCASGPTCLIFSGTLAGDLVNDFSINDLVIDFPGGGDTVLSNGDCFSSFYTACNFFFGFVNVPSTGPPGTLLSTDSFTGPIFEIDVDPAIPVGLYNGTATILGD